MKTVSLKEILGVYDGETINSAKLTELAMRVAAGERKNVERQENCSLLRAKLLEAYDLNDANSRFVDHKIDELRKLYAQKPSGIAEIKQWQQKVELLENYGVAEELFFCWVKKYRTKN